LLVLRRHPEPSAKDPPHSGGVNITVTLLVPSTPEIF
jgi:hypothetical protein